MRILLTGGYGFLGSFVWEKLVDAGHAPRAFRSSEFNLLSLADAERAIGDVVPDAVVHLAASVGGIGANKASPGKFGYENLAMGMNVLEAARTRGVKKVVMAGSVCAYPQNCPVPFREEDLWNGYPEHTNAPYGLAKKMALVLGQAYRQQYGLNSIHLLIVNLYGARDSFDPQLGHVVPGMIRKFHDAAQSGAKSVTLWGDGTPTRELLYVEDCADAVVAALERYDGADPVNVGNGVETPMSELALKIAKVTGFSGEIIWDASMPNGQPRRCLDVSKAERLFGWRAKVGLDDGLARTYEWFRAQEWPAPW